MCLGYVFSTYLAILSVLRFDDRLADEREREIERERERERERAGCFILIAILHLCGYL